MSNKTSDALDHLELCQMAYMESVGDDGERVDSREANARMNEWMAAREYFHEQAEKINTWRMIALGLFLALLLT